MRSMRGTTLENLPGHLAEVWYRSLNPNDGPSIFKNILFDLKKFYGEVDC